MISREAVINMEDIQLCDKIKLESVSAYSMRLVYTGDTTGIAYYTDQETLTNLVENTKYDIKVKKLVKNMIENIYAKSNIEKTLLKSVESVEFARDKQTIDQINLILDEIGFYELESCLQARYILEQSKYREELGLDKLIDSSYSNIDASKKSKAALQCIYAEAVEKAKLIHTSFECAKDLVTTSYVSRDFHTGKFRRNVQIDRSEYSTEIVLLSRIDKITDFLEAVYAMSTGRSALNTSADYIDLMNAADFEDDAIRIVMYKLRLTKSAPSGICITQSIREDVLAIEKLFGFINNIEG